MKVLITGITGFVGSHLAEFCQNLGNVEVVGTYRWRSPKQNIAHIKAFWIMITPRVAQIALSYGADDIDGTVTTEEIVHAAGAETSQSLSRRDMVTLIMEAGREPVERDTLYHSIGIDALRAPASPAPRA